MQWSDEGIVLTAKRFGEEELIVSILTRAYGRHLGLVKKRGQKGGSFQPGTKMTLQWKARLAEHLGAWSGDVVFSALAYAFTNSVLLGALHSASALLEMILPEREPHADIYEAFQSFIYSLPSSSWPEHYIALERVLLRNAGIVLDFTRCAATGTTENLIYVSPRSGRAVSQEGGAPYKDKLLPLPTFLRPAASQDHEKEPEDILQALEMTEPFLSKFILNIHHLKMPDTRERLKDKLRRQAQERKKVKAL